MKTRRKQVVADIVVERRIGIGRKAFPVDLQLAADLLMLALQHLVAAQMIEGAPLGGGHQPGARVVGNALARPLLQRRNQRLLREFLGQPDIAHDAGQPGDQLGLLDAPDGVDRAVRRRGGGRSGSGWFRWQRDVPAGSKCRRRPHPHLVVVERRAAVWRAGVGAGQHVDALAALMRAIRPDAFGDDDAAAHAVEQLRMQHDLAARVADLDAIAGSDAEMRGVVRVDHHLRPAPRGSSSPASP